MDLQTEIDIKKDLRNKARIYEGKVDEAKAELLSAEQYLTDVVAEAYGQGAGVSLIASCLNTNRQRVYLLLASKGIRPGKDVINAST